MKILLLLFLVPIMSFGQSLLVEVDQLFQNREYSVAEELITEYLNENPNDLVAIELLGDSYGFQKKWDETIKTYEILVKKEDNNANYHYKYGGALGMKALESNKIMALLLVDDLKRVFLKAAKLDPEHIETRWALVELYVQLPGIIGGSLKKSLVYANELQDLSLVDGYLAKGYIYEYDKQPEKAEKYYKMAIDIGGSITCYEKLSTFYENKNQPEKAIETIEEASNRHQRNALHYQLGKVSAEYNVQLDKGEKCLNIFIKNHSVKDGVPVEWAFYRLAQIYKHKKNKSRALEYINRSLYYNPEFKLAESERKLILKM
jgi:tetratricopeptide (TPR) repeat protein